MKSRIPVSAGVALLFMFLILPVHPRDTLADGLDEQQKIRLLKDIVEARPFLKSSSVSKWKKYTLGKFFDQRIYRKLKGNDILGYEYNDGFKNESETVFIRSVRTTEKTAPFRAEFLSAVKKILREGKIVNSRSSPTEIGIALLDVEKEHTSKTLPGALVEVYFKNRRTGKCFYYRFGTGKRSGYRDAFSDIWTVTFAVLESFR